LKVHLHYSRSLICGYIIYGLCLLVYFLVGFYVVLLCVNYFDLFFLAYESDSILSVYIILTCMFCLFVTRTITYVTYRYLTFLSNILSPLCHASLNRIQDISWEIIIYVLLSPMLIKSQIKGGRATFCVSLKDIYIGCTQYFRMSADAVVAIVEIFTCICF